MRHTRFGKDNFVLSEKCNNLNGFIKTAVNIECLNMDRILSQGYGKRIFTRPLFLGREILRERARRKFTLICFTKGEKLLCVLEEPNLWHITELVSYTYGEVGGGKAYGTVSRPPRPRETRGGK